MITKTMLCFLVLSLTVTALVACANPMYTDPHVQLPVSTNANSNKQN